MQVDFTHHGEHGDHNVSGMITTAQRIINALPAVVAAEPGIVRAIDLPLVTGRGLVEHDVSILDSFAIDRPGRHRHRRRPRARRRHRRRARRGRAPTSSSPRAPPTSSSRWPSAGPRGRAAGRSSSPPTSATSTRSPGWRRRRTTSSAGSTPWSTTSVAPSRRGFLDTSPRFLTEAFSFNVATAHALTRAAVPLMLKSPDGQQSVVTISSMMGRTADRGFVAYGTAKAALAHWTRMAAQDLAPRIRVNGIYVGSIMTSALEFVAGQPDDDEPARDQDPAGPGRRARGHRGRRALPGLEGRASTSPAS